MDRTVRYASMASACALLACGLLPRALAADALSLRVDVAIRQQMTEQRIPGLSLAVVRDGTVVKTAGYGIADLELHAVVRPQTVFAAGSITKQFVASGVMLLAETGAVQLDDSIAVYFPEAPPTWKPITVRHLLTHTSGIADYWGDTEDTHYSKGVIDFHREYTDDEAARAYFAQPLEAQPGERWRYNNAEYNLLGMLIHRVTGKTYADFLRERVFAPLKMDRTRLFSWAEIIPDRARGYDLVGGAWRNAGTWMSQSVMAGADGGLLTTVLDLARWDAALYSGKILMPSTLDEMWTPMTIATGSASAAGIGWFIAAARGHRVLYHTGGGYGFYADIARYVDDRLTIIVMMNIDESHTDVLKVVAAIAEIYLPDTKGGNPVKDW